MSDNAGKPFELRDRPDDGYRRRGVGDPTYVAAPGTDCDAYVRQAVDGKFVFSAPYEIGFLEVVVSDEFAEAWRREFAGRPL